MAKKVEEECKGGLPGWMGTYGDLVTLLLCFFVLLFAMSSVDASKFQAALSYFKEQVDVMPGGIALTGEELITNGVSQINEIADLIEQQNPTVADTEDIGPDRDAPATDVGDYEFEQGSETETTISLEEAKALAEAKAQEIADQIAADFNETLRDEGILDEVTVEAKPNYVILTLKGEALFELGEATIKPEAERIIRVISSTYQDSYGMYDLMVEGHTDDLPINTYQYPNNWYLSAARAISVGEYLIDNLGIPENQVACTGYGEYRPIAANDTPENRAANRRVEIKINLGDPDAYISKDTILNLNPEE